MSGGNKKKAEFLGMPYGTACGRLRKQIMFRLLQRLGEATCLRCGEAIESADELSVEHIKPWLYVSTNLFWDLANITFSHRRCNTTDRPSYSRRAPAGTHWCSGCKDYRPVEQFGPPISCGKKRNGLRRLRGYCKACRARRRAQGQSY